MYILIFTYKSKMMKNGTKALLFSCVFLYLEGCETVKNEENGPEVQISKIRAEFAPDKRVALFEVSAIKNNENYILKGESDMPAAIDALKQKLTAEHIQFVDSIQLLPTAELEDKTQAIVNISVANLRSNPKHSAELATQATLGTPVKVLKRKTVGSIYKHLINTFHG